MQGGVLILSIYNGDAIFEAKYSLKLSKQASGETLTEAEIKFMNDYKNSLVKLGLQMDEQGNLVDI